jgi:hypothetical protein
MRQKSIWSAGFLALLLTIAAAIGCSKSANVAEKTDAQLAGDVQTRISGDPALSGRAISINANKGVVTLSGTVNSDAEVTSALNDAQQAEGVKQVVSKLQVQNAAAQPPAPEPQPTQTASAPPPSRRPSPSHERTSRHSLPSASSYSGGSGASSSMASDNAATSTPPPAPQAYTPPPPPPPPQPVTVPAGTVLQVRTVEALSSETSHENDMFHGTLNADLVVDDKTVIPAGADVSGRVVEAHPSTHYSGAASLVLQLEKIGVNGRTYTVATDTWEKKGTARGKNTAEKVGGGAAVGAILGGIFGGGRGAAIGATAGAGAGAGANTITKGQRVDLRPETLLSFRLQNPISVMPTGSNQRRGTVIHPDDQGSDPQ